MSDETYNGWKNYPTWSVHLWLTNDEGLYNATTDMVATLRESRADVADALKESVSTIAPDLGASFAADLLGYALDQVDWFEIADAFLED